jgi:hypothetical protein
MIQPQQQQQHREFSQDSSSATATASNIQFIYDTSACVIFYINSFHVQESWATLLHNPDRLIHVRVCS